MRILLVNYRYFISGGPEKYMFNIKKMLEDNGHEVIPFSIHSNKNVETEYSKYFVEPIGSRDATYFEECKKTPKVIWQMLTRSIYSTEVEKAIKKEIKDVKPDLVYIIHFVNKLSPSVICGAKKMGVPVVLRLSDYFLLCPRFDFMYNKKPCEECLTKGYRTCIKKRCVKGSLFASVVRVFSMKVHKAMNVYKGVDGFVCFLRDHPTIMGVYMKPVYSHCNYSELAADFGIVGLLLWYIPILRIFYWGWQTKSSGYIEGCIYAIFVSIVISDYSRFPWDTHLSMYLLFIIVLLIRFDFLDKKRGNT